MREISAEKLSEFILTKYENTTDEDVFPYNEELITNEYPVFVKFHELWSSSTRSLTCRCHLSARPRCLETHTSTLAPVLHTQIPCRSHAVPNPAWSQPHASLRSLTGRRPMTGRRRLRRRRRIPPSPHKEASGKFSACPSIRSFPSGTVGARGPCRYRQTGAAR